jgi:predicted MFS family arabinose efflux permease
VGLILVWMLAAALVLPFFNIYFQRVHQMPVARIGLLFGAVQGLTALAVFAGGEVAYRVGPGRALAGWVFVFPVALLALVAGPPLALAIAIYAVQGLVPPATNPLLDEIVLNRADPSVHGAASSWRNGATELSGLLGASLGGLILASTGFGTLFGIAAAVAAVGGGALARSVVARRA